MKTQLTTIQTKHALWPALFALMIACVAGHSQTTNYFNDGFETTQAQDCWISDFGFWEIGVPTYGPPTNSLNRRAHQGTYVAATVLNGDYTDDRESRLISCPISIPAASQNPRLRFWHWWSFGPCDYGQVQISTNNGVNWVALSPPYAADSSGRWTRGWLDLSPYAGRTVRLGLFFHAESYFCGGVGPGWYVDEIAIESGSLPTVITPDSFEDAAASDRWNADLGVWEIGVPTSGPGAAHAGSNCLATILSGNYTDDRESRISSQPFVVPNTNPRLRFWHWWSFGPCDYGQVQISTNNGVNWIALSPQYATDSSGRWTRGWLDLTPYAGRTVRVGLFFHAESYFCGGVGPGWYVDEIAIESGPLPMMIAADNFEDAAAADRWKADSGVWEIGVPTSGPGAAHAGSNCLATILSGNYTDDRESRVSSQPFVVPPAKTNPRLRFWHWWSFGPCDYGQVQISTNDGSGWIALAAFNASAPWAQREIDLVAYAGQTVRLGFFFHAESYFCGGVGPGWYIDEVRLLHDFALLAGSTIIRTQQAGCVSLGIAASVPPTTVSFNLQAPAQVSAGSAGGALSNLTLNVQSCWSIMNFSSLGNAQFSITLSNSCSTTPMGVKDIGTLCFSAASTQSGFAPLTVNGLSVINQGGSPAGPVYGLGGRAVLIGDQPLLEAWRGANGQRMVTTYGKPNTGYEVRSRISVPGAAPWILRMTNLMPSTMSYSQPIPGIGSNAPVFFIQANER